MSTQRFLFGALAVLAGAARLCPADESPSASAPWPAEKAAAWYAKQPWLVGCNFLPSTAINQVEMFQPGTYDPATIRRELGWARELGFNTLRVFLHDMLWKEEARDGFLKNFDDFSALDLAASVDCLKLLRKVA